jgi:hypothetical protein
MTTIYRCDGCRATYDLIYEGVIGGPHYKLTSYGVDIDLCPDCDIKMSTVISDFLEELAGEKNVPRSESHTT